MGRTNIVLEDELVKAGMELSGARSRRELVHNALTAYVAWLRRCRIKELRGRIEYHEGYDHTHLRQGRTDDPGR